jgi:predicted nucleotidyltransferase
MPLLKLFILSPGLDFYQRELADLTGERLLLVQRAVARLVQAGLVNHAARGNRVYYRVDKSHPAFQDLKAVILKTVGIGDALRMQLARFGERIRIAFVYGSVARGEETVSSDVDIMLIGNLSGREVASVFSPVKKMLNREINPTIYSPVEFRKRVKERHPFLISVLKEPKLFLLGDERGLKAVLNGRPA